MYKWYAIKRILKGIVIYSLLIFTFSLLFNKVADETQRSQIEEQVRAETMRQKGKKAEELKAFQDQRRKALIRLYGLDKPYFEKVISRTVKTLTFNFGKSTIIKSSDGDRDVRKIIFETIPRSLLLFTLAAIIELIIAIILGLKKAQNPGKSLDKGTTLVTMILYGLPTWWLAMLLVMLFAYIIKIFPSGGMYSSPPPEGIMRLFDMLYHMILPLATLVLLGFWGGSFFIRNIVLSILQEDYIMSARARGIPEKKVLFGHTLRSAAPPIVTMVLLGIIGSLGGAIIFEGIFSWPGMGNLYWIALQQNDIPVLLADLAITTGIYQLGLIALDLIYGFLDPRIKVGGKA